MNRTGKKIHTSVLDISDAVVSKLADYSAECTGWLGGMTGDAQCDTAMTDVTARLVISEKSPLISETIIYEKKFNTTCFYLSTTWENVNTT